MELRKSLLKMQTLTAEGLSSLLNKNNNMNKNPKNKWTKSQAIKMSAMGQFAIYKKTNKNISKLRNSGKYVCIDIFILVIIGTLIGYAMVVLI